MEVHTGRLDQGLTLTIPEAFAAELGLEANSLVDVSVRGSSIIVRLATRAPARLDDLLTRVTEANRHDEIDTGEAVGREVW